MPLSCYLCHQRATPDGSITLHALPAPSHVRDQWLNVLRPAARDAGALHVCSRHFHPSDFYATMRVGGGGGVSRLLRSTAVPSAKLLQAQQQQPPPPQQPDRNALLGALRKLRDVVVVVERLWAAGDAGMPLQAAASTATLSASTSDDDDDDDDEAAMRAANAIVAPATAAPRSIISSATTTVASSSSPSRHLGARGVGAVSTLGRIRLLRQTNRNLRKRVQALEAFVREMQMGQRRGGGGGGGGAKTYSRRI